MRILWDSVNVQKTDLYFESKINDNIQVSWKDSYQIYQIITIKSKWIWINLF